MAHSIETATSGRAKCRGCGQAIAKGALRLGERLPNPFGDGEMTLWFHPLCGALKRPEVFLEALESYDGELDDRDALRTMAEPGLEHRRLPRVDGASRAPTGRAQCRSCRQTIEKDSWRIGLVFYEEGRFNPAGYIHVGCAAEYLGTSDIIDRVRHFSPELTNEDLLEIREQLDV